MASVKGVNKTLADTTGGIGTANLIARGAVGGNVKVMVDSYEAAALATDSTISMGPTLPVGARVVGFTLAYDALKTVSLSLGDSASGARYLASFDSANTAGIKNEILVDGVDYVIGTAASDNQIVVKTTGVSSATGTIKVAVYYTEA